MVKRNKVVAMLMAGLMAVSPISQPVSIYASESDVETVVQEEPSEEVQEEPAAEPEISDESTELEESSAPQEDIDINYDDSGGDMFSDGSTEDLSVFDTEEQEATVQSLQWTGRINETDITAKLSCESGSKMDASDILEIKETEKEAKKELETKISAMAVNSCASVKFGFDVSRKDKNGEEKEKNISYKISLNMADISALKGLKLYHQKENGDMEELTFTAGSDENGGQKVEFVSAEGLGSFVFAEISEDLTVNDEPNTTDAPKNDTAVQDSEENIEDLTVNTENISEEPQVTEEDAAAGNTQENPDADPTGSVIPVDISEFQVSFVSGAENADGKNVWNPSDPTKGHSFIYRVNYTMSGTFSTDIGAFKIELPLHILKDKDGNWADTFNCPYWLRSEVTEEDNPDFVYEIDEENNKVTIYNYKPYPTGEAGYVEFSYETTKDTMQYLDMGASTKVHAKVYATNESSTVTKESEADEVYAVVTGNAGLGDKQYFKFNVKLSSDNADLTKLISGEKMYGDTVFKDGEGLVYLGGGDKAVIDGIPAGVNYTITEEPNEDYNVSWTGTAGSGNENTYSGAVEANVTHEIMCTNTYAKSTGGGSSTEHPAEYGVLKLTKQFVNITGDKNATLHIAFWNLDKNLSYKYSDGTSEKEFTSDATGMADVTLSVTDNQEFTFSDLPTGCKYQISEEAGDYISSYDVSGTTQIAQQHGENFDVNKALTTAKETINKNDVAVVAFTNTGKETPKDEDKLVNVHVEKTWNDNDNAAGMRPDSITVQLTQDGDVVATATLDADTKWQTDFTDLDKYTEDGTTECDYEVNEIDVPGYKSEIKTVSEDKTKSFTITNSIEDVGDLKVTKTVKGDGADLTQDFRFTVALEKDGKPLAGTFNLDGNKGTKTGTVALDEDGTASFTLKHGESIYMKDIPAGVKWTVTEIVQSGYTEANNGKYSGSITKGKASTADVVNTYNPSHKVTVKKTVKGNQGDKTKQFKFQMSITGNGVPGNLAYAKNGKAGSVAVKNGIAEFTLGHKDVIVFKEVPEGVEYAVTELDGESNGYTVESKNASGTLNKDTEISFVNTKDVGVPTAAMTNTGAIAGVVMAGVIGIMAIVILKRKKRSEK